VTTKELKELIKILKQNGVSQYTHEGLSIQLYDKPTTSRKPSSRQRGIASQNEPSEIEEDIPTEEDLLFYSTGN
jgi:hypothetical protein